MKRVVGEALAGIVPGDSRWVIARCLPRASEVQPPGALAITLPRTMMPSRWLSAGPSGASCISTTNFGSKLSDRLSNTCHGKP